MSRFVPVNEPRLGRREAAYAAEALASGWISGDGPWIERFEAAVGACVGRTHGVAVSSGSAALDIALAALDLQPGDEVILPTFTIISCAAAVVRAGATPVVVDCDPETFNMTAEAVAARIGARTRAIMAVHIYGLPVDMDPLLALARQHALVVIEDAAEVIGQTCRGTPCGKFGRISTFSFYANKIATTGEGGMALTDDATLAERMRRLRNLGHGVRRFVHDEIAWNYRLGSLQAAIGLAQIEGLDDALARKRAIGARYTEMLAGTPGLRLPLAATDYARNVYWVYPVVLEDERCENADEIMARLAEAGVGTRPFFWPMHEQPALLKRGLFRGETYPHAERLARRGFYLPSGLTLTDDDIAFVCGALRRVLR